MAPRREEREIEMSNTTEAIRQHEKVTDIATESEGSTGRTFENAPFTADE